MRVCVCAATNIQKQIKWDTQGPDQAHIVDGKVLATTSPSDSKY